MQTIHIDFGERSYDIKIEGGCLTGLGAFVRERVGEKAAKACIATTETVAGLYLEAASESLKAAGFEVIEIVVPDGEEHKTLQTFETIMTRLIEERFERSSVMVPLGGGVIGDTAGFVAAAYLRGIPFVQAPTTIVSQVDSSIGGKVAVNHPLGKNLIGHFYQPRGVWIDTHVLTTLEPREVLSGMGEVVKHAVIRDKEFFEFLEEHVENIMSFNADDDVMERFIAWNCRIKAGVVAEDEREGGIRAILNYGHTVGHALEAVTGYRRYKHGEAVILGMLAAGHMAVSKVLLSREDFDRQNALLSRVGINRVTDGLEISALYKAMTHDKKVSAGTIRFVLADTIGHADIYSNVTRDEMEAGIAFMIAFMNK